MLRNQLPSRKIVLLDFSTLILVILFCLHGCERHNGLQNPPKAIDRPEILPAAKNGDSIDCGWGGDCARARTRTDGGAR